MMGRTIAQPEEEPVVACTSLEGSWFGFPARPNQTYYPSEVKELMSDLSGRVKHRELEKTFFNSQSEEVAPCIVEYITTPTLNDSGNGARLELGA